MFSYSPIFFISLSISFYFFFNNPWLISDYYSDSYSWFVDFSRSIFQPQSAYYAESILLPLIGKIIGAARSILFYKSLCAALVVGILPIIGVLAQRYFKSFYKALAFILLFGLSFQYVQFFILGFPDPLTITLLVAAIFARKAMAVFFLITLASLSHFSMAAIGVLALAGLVYASPVVLRISRGKYLSSLLLALLAGKLILFGWYSIFHYQLQSRLDWAFGKGYGFFLERYIVDLQGFWLTPGVLFLVLYGLIAVYFLICRQFLVVTAAIFALALAYLALFWTVDGLRVFAVVISAAYGYLLVSFIQSIAMKLNSKAANKGLL
jgi:hypothetical protein